MISKYEYFKAVEEGNIDLVRSCVDEMKYLDINLQIAAKHGYMHIVKLMLEKGASNYDAAILAAGKAGHTEIVQLLADKVSASSLYLVLLHSITGNHTDIILLMLHKGVSCPDRIRNSSSEEVKILFSRFKEGKVKL